MPQSLLEVMEQSAYLYCGTKDPVEALAQDFISRVKVRPLEHPFVNTPSHMVRAYHNLSTKDMLRFWDMIRKETHTNDFGI